MLLLYKSSTVFYLFWIEPPFEPLLLLSDYDYDYYGYGDYQGGYAADPYYDDYYGGRYDDYYDYGYGAAPRPREPVGRARAGPERVGYVAGVLSSIVHH